MMDPAVAAALHGLPPGLHHQVPVQLHPHPAAAHHLAMAQHHHMVHPEMENDEKILADIAAEGRERYQNTLVGRLAEYMRDVGEPVSLAQCTEALRDVFPELKKPDGTRYKGSLERAIHGALWSTGVFRKNEHDMWTLKDDDAVDYERKLTGKFQERSKKRKNLSATAKTTFSLMKKQRRKYTRKSGKRGDIVRLLASFSQGHKEAADRAAMADGGNVPPELQALFKNPFKGWNLTDSEIKIRRKIGDEKYLFLMQIFHYFEDVLAKALEPDELGMGGMLKLSDASRVLKAPVSGSYGAVQKQLAAILQRISNVETTLVKDPTSAAV